MKFIVYVIVFVVMLVGCASGPSLSPGRYSLDMKMTKRGVAKDYHDISECLLTVQGTNVVLKPTRIAERDLVGSITGTHLALSVRHHNPDPMIEGMKLRIILEGEITKSDFAAGTANGYSETNKYITGIWTLRKLGDNGTSN